MASGLLLIGLGSFFLAVNLFGLTFLRGTAQALQWLVDYWPLVLVIWGVAKIAKRFMTPERSRVSGLEVAVLVVVVLAGLGLTATRRAMSHLAEGADWSGFAEVFGPEFLGPRREFVDEQSFPLASGSSLFVENQRGNVRISGWSEDRLQVMITKYIHDFGENEARRTADQIQLELAPHGNGNRLSVVAPERLFVETELTIRLPRSTALDIRNRRGGSITVHDMEASADLTTREGPIEVLRSTGDVNARTNRSAIRVEDISGPVEASTRNGDIVVLRVTGDLDASTSSADLVADDIAGNAKLSVRHGTLRVRRASGSVDLEANDAEVSIESAQGPVRIDSRRGELHLRDLSSSLDVRARRTTLRASSVAGDVTVDVGDRPITLRRIGGSLKINATGADVSLAEVAGPTIIEGAPNDVHVSDFSGNLTVRSHHGEIHADTTDLSGDVRLETSYGDIELALSPTTSAVLDFSTQDGQLQSAFPGVEIESEAAVGAERRWKGQIGSGLRAVTLITTYGDIRLRAEGQ
ncbi:MAG TPA: DUF4097 family beta strand repeat-containing protein [Vicinamibacteria bacterium]|nr:DUF4097 family beta strand repeat-containing protein [Vicinamibacteria bacterium]